MQRLSKQGAFHCKLLCGQFNARTTFSMYAPRFGL